MICEDQKIYKVITVENKANFKSIPYTEGTLVLYSHGYFSPLERDFLIKLRLVLGDTQVEYYHTGDLDYGGVKIFQYIKHNIFPALKPLYMDTETYWTHERYAEPMKESKVRKLSSVKEPLLQPLIDLLCEEKRGIEQESFLVDVFSQKKV